MPTGESGPITRHHGGSMTSIYAQFGLEAAINAAGTLTRVGGSRMDPEVLAAMTAAADGFVSMDRLQAAASQRIGRFTGAEAGIVTSGAAAALTLAAAACIAGDDPAKMDRLPNCQAMPHKIIMPRSQRNGYDHALRAAGATIVDVGLAERTRDPQAWEIAAAIDDDTVAIAFCVGFSELPLRLVVDVARQHGLPVIVDAAAALPPKSNLGALIDAGADLVCFSGGKAIRGPQSSGILCGRQRLIASAALQMLDMDYVPELWQPPESLFAVAGSSGCLPNHGIGRGMKVGKEEIIGLLVALERFVALDENADRERLDRLSQRIAASISNLGGVDVSLQRDTPHEWQKVIVDILPNQNTEALQLVRALENGNPPIYVMQARAPQGRIGIDPFGLREHEADLLIERLAQLLGES